MKDEIIKKIKAKYQGFVILFAILLCISVPLSVIFTIALIIDGEWHFEGIFVVALSSILSIYWIFRLRDSIKMMTHPLEGAVFKKYGGIENVVAIINEIENTIEYEDNQLILSKRFLMEKNDYEVLVAYEDILRVHKLVHRTNGIVDRIGLVITDKYGAEFTFNYERKFEKNVDSLILLIGKKSKNAVLGYSFDTSKYVSNHTESLKEKDVNPPSLDDTSNKTTGTLDEVNTFINKAKTMSKEELNDLINENKQKMKESEEKLKKTVDEIMQKNNKTNNKKKYYCTECGAEIEESWKFCHECGNKLK